MLTYPEGRSLVGHFGFTTGYRNRLDVLGPNVAVAVDRYTSMPGDMTATIRVDQHNQKRPLEVAPADMFAIFRWHVKEAIEERQFGSFAATLLRDAKLLDRLRKSAIGTAKAP